MPNVVGRPPPLLGPGRHPDTRSRREVVGQMLDYAANAVVYCPGVLELVDEALCKPTGHRIGSFGMLFSCSVLVGAVLVGGGWLLVRCFFAS